VQLTDQTCWWWQCGYLVERRSNKSTLGITLDVRQCTCRKTPMDFFSFICLPPTTTVRSNEASWCHKVNRKSTNVTSLSAARRIAMSKCVVMTTTRIPHLRREAAGPLQLSTSFIYERKTSSGSSPSPQNGGVARTRFNLSAIVRANLNYGTRHQRCSCSQHPSNDVRFRLSLPPKYSVDGAKNQR